MAMFLVPYMWPSIIGWLIWQRVCLYICNPQNMCLVAVLVTWRYLINIFVEAFRCEMMRIRIWESLCFGNILENTSKHSSCSKEWSTDYSSRVPAHHLREPSLSVRILKLLNSHKHQIVFTRHYKCPIRTSYIQMMRTIKVSIFDKTKNKCNQFTSFSILQSVPLIVTAIIND